MQQLKVFIALLYVIICWAFNTVVIKLAFKQLDPVALVGLRFATMPFLALLLMRLSGDRIKIERQDLPLLIACGICGYSVYQFLWVIGLDHTTAIASALLSCFSPLFTLGILAVTGYERVRGVRWLGAVVALAGVAVFEGFFSGHGLVRIGDVLTLIAAALFAVYSVISARLLKRYTPFALVTITMSIGALIIVPASLYKMIHTDYVHLSLQTWLILAYTITFPIVLTWPVWNWGIGKIGPARTSFFSYLTPIIAGALSIPILHAKITGYEIAGVAICIGGMTVANLLGHFSISEWWASRALGAER